VGIPTGIELDVARGKVYWVESSSPSVKVGNINGTGSPKVLFDGSDGLVAPDAIALKLVPVSTSVSSPSALVFLALVLLSVAVYLVARRDETIRRQTV